MKPDPNKPPYRVLTMKQVCKVKPNGYKVVSTFSGCGGSCTGLKMAGFQILWANEFIPAAQETYQVNHKGTFLETRDIRLVKPEEVLKQTGLRVGELDVLEGSPPCSSFSTAGKREAGWNVVKKYSDTKQRTDDLFFEYIRLLNGLQPKVFIAENVSGLVKGTAKGYFLEILAGLKACGYNVKAKLLDAQWLGVPQQRQRIIFVGVRDDLKLNPAFPAPLKYRYSVKDALPHIFEVRKGGGFGDEKWVGADTVGADTVGASLTSGNNYNNNVGAVLARVVNVVHDTGGNSPNRWAADVNVTDRPCPAVTVGVNSVNSNHFKIQLLPPSLMKAEAYGVSEVKADSPSPTVTIASPGNDLAVPYGVEKRKFTIAELKRICAFPDDFILTGSYAQQWERLGRSVPPVMMFHIAKTIRDEILCKT